MYIKGEINERKKSEEEDDIETDRLIKLEIEEFLEKERQIERKEEEERQKQRQKQKEEEERRKQKENIININGKKIPIFIPKEQREKQEYIKEYLKSMLIFEAEVYIKAMIDYEIYDNKFLDISSYDIDMYDFPKKIASREIILDNSDYVVKKILIDDFHYSPFIFKKNDKGAYDNYVRYINEIIGNSKYAIYTDRFL